MHRPHRAPSCFRTSDAQYYLVETLGVSETIVDPRKAMCPISRKES